MPRCWFQENLHRNAGQWLGGSQPAVLGLPHSSHMPPIAKPSRLEGWEEAGKVRVLYHQAKD